MPFSDQVSYLLKRAIPDALEPVVRRAVGGAIPRLGEEDRYRIAYTGAFSSRVAADLLAFGRNQRLDGALILIDDDALRALYYRGGQVIGAESNVLFERLGRVLGRADAVDEAKEAELVRIEETSGVAAVTQKLPPNTARFALERRAWEIAAALFLIHRGHFLIVEGAPDLGPVEPLTLDAMDLALEGLRRYDEWRNGASGTPVPSRRSPSSRPPESPETELAASSSKPSRRSKKAEALDEVSVEDFMRRLRTEA